MFFQAALLLVPLLGVTATVIDRDEDIMSIDVMSDPMFADFLESSSRVKAPRAKCPVSCSEAGTNATNWARYSDLWRLERCNETMLLNFAVHNPLDDANTDSVVRACSADLASLSGRSKREEKESEKSCNAGNQIKTTASITLSSSDGSSGNSSAGIIAASQQIINYIGSFSEDGCDTDTINFAMSGSSVVGLFAGSRVQRQGIPTSVLNDFIQHVEDGGVGDRALVQYCGNQDQGADYILGIVTSNDKDLGFVQNAVKTWSEGRCATDVRIPEGSSWKTVDMLVIPPRGENGTGNANSSSDATLAPRWSSHGRNLNLHPRAECTTTTVAANDTCYTLSQKCGASFTDFMTWNADACASVLMVGQHMCCTAGDLPDFAPKPNADGTCFTYTTIQDDNCSKLAGQYSLTVDDLEDFNKDTWGWTGCKNLFASVAMCLSTGTPPMPAPDPTAQCGPQVAGTLQPTDGTKLADLNPCPLNACCDIWGQCGTTAEFCTESKSESGAPGTAAPGENGCISNCGTDIIKGDKPANFNRVGYFEAWNWDRDCLNMHVDAVRTEAGDPSSTSELYYDTIHFAFANITEDFGISIAGMEPEFDTFKSMSLKKILSFGGWSFSTSADTYPIFRETVTPANRQLFAQNVVKFLEEHNLDGVDFDWEYPGAQDIPGVPPGSSTDGPYYWQFLKYQKSIMPAGKTVSIAAPASYWYLKNFPIKLIGEVVDYIIYMTYDLHGQWDYDNDFSQPGCKAGNCLRSHINYTETLTALSMVTKAGVPSSKVIVGTTTYGRSFKMTKAGCYDDMCTYAGPDSQAAPGRCTKTAGYISNAEIYEILDSDRVTVLDYQGSDKLSNIMVYDETEWVAYMTPQNRALRQALYQVVYNMGGSSCWAVDLDEFHDYVPPNVEELLPDCNDSYDTLDDVENNAGKIPDNCMNQYVTQALSNNITASLKKYNDILKDGYDEKFGYYEKTIRAEWEANLKEIYDNHLDEYFTCIHSVADGSGSKTFHNETGVCPPDSDGHEFTIYLVPKDLNGMYDYIEKNYNIDRSWLGWRDFFYGICLDGPDPATACPDFGWVRGIPDLRSDFEVPNPKDTIGNSLQNITEMAQYLSDAAVDMRVLTSDAIDSHVVDGSALPVMMVSSAVSSMEQVYEIGEEVEKKEREQLILLFLTAILFVIPGIGEALAGVTGIAVIARIAAIVAEAGNAGLGIFDIVQNPKNAPLAIFGILLGGMALRSSKSFSEAANIRRGMTAEKIGDLGIEVKSGMDKIGRLVKVCKVK